MEFYWDLGADIVERQKSSVWGSGFLKQLSADLMKEFPDVKGFSYRNIRLIVQWFKFYYLHPANLATSCCQITKQDVKQLTGSSKANCDTICAAESESSAKRVTTCYPNSVTGCEQIGKQLVSQIPWGQNIVIISKCSSLEEALFYVKKTIENGWSRSVLKLQIESNLWERAGKAITNFETHLPAVESDLARQILKDPYDFEFLTLTEDFKERELEKGLINHIEKFLLELGNGFAFVGRQYQLTLSDKEFYCDLLFYHLELRCFVVIDLKAGEFKPEYAGKMNFYCNIVDDLLRKDGDAPTIGMILCKEKDKLIVEYALKRVDAPMGVSEYQITKELPKELKSALPSVEQIEAEIEDDF